MTGPSRLQAPEFPGLSLRVHEGGIAVAARMAPLANAVNALEGVDELVTLDELENWLGYPTASFDPASDVVLAEVGGDLVGYAWVDWVDTSDGLRDFRMGGYVHPDWRGRGIGRRLLAWQEQHAAEHPAAVASDRPLFLGTWAPDERLAKRHLFERAGYIPTRYFFEMRRDLQEAIEVPPMPEGLEVRPIGTDRASQRLLWDADVEAFQDHWGGFDASDASFEKMLVSPEHQPGLWIVAWDGEQVAGAVTNAVFAAENESFGRRRGWLATVFVRRPWRRRGLGAAIVSRALVRLREEGMQEAHLGVDSDNPTGALGHYERTGLSIYRRAAADRRPLERDQ